MKITENKDYKKFLECLKKLEIEVEVIDEDDDYISLSLSNEVQVDAFCSKEKVVCLSGYEVKEIVAFDIGYNCEVGGGYMEPPETEFESHLRSKKLVEVLEKVLLLPLETEVYHKVASILEIEY